MKKNQIKENRDFLSFWSYIVLFFLSTFFSCFYCLCCRVDSLNGANLEKVSDSLEKCDPCLPVWRLRCCSIWYISIKLSWGIHYPILICYPFCLTSVMMDMGGLKGFEEFSDSYSILTRNFQDDKRVAGVSVKIKQSLLISNG